MKRINLNGQYRLYTYDYQTAPREPQGVGGSFIHAEVPGNVELDYVRAGIFDDLLYGQNFRQAESLEWKDFWYVREFTFDEEVSDADVYLCFDGVDTVAEYFLNDTRIGISDNMFIEHRYPVQKALRRGENTLAIHIRSVMAYAKQFRIRPHNVAFSGCYESLSVRKAAINYGWDISPRLLSAGIWRDVYIEVADEVRFRDVYLATASVNDEAAVLVLSCNAVVPDAYIGKCRLRIEGDCEGHHFSSEYPFPYPAATVYPYVYGAKLWNPMGMGRPHLYDIVVQIVCDGVVLAEHRLRYGIRTARLEFGDAIGEKGRFVLYINNRRVRCRGANWVPVSLLHSQDKAGYREAVENFRDCNCNMVRVWGGGVYEGDEFFELCDEYGIMVWQDMMLACHGYPMTEQFCRTMAAECEAVAGRIRNHPSLVLYCGGNETDWPYVCTGLNPNDDVITRDVLKNTLYQMDPYRSYLPSTPYFSETFVREHGGRFYMDLQEIKQARVSLPQEHYWWHRTDFLEVREQNHQFLSEIGYSAASERSVLNAYMPRDSSFEDEHAWRGHSFPTEDGQRDCYAYLFENVPQSDEAKLQASQHYQAEAYKFVVELCRMRPEQNGILLWTMRENWPSFSSALADYYGKRKAAFYAVKTSYEPLQCMIDVRDGVAECFLVNDLPDTKTVAVQVTDEQGHILYAETVTTMEDVPVTKLTDIPLQGEQLLLTTVRDGAAVIRNYRYVYEDKINYTQYRELYKTQFGNR